MPMFMYHRVQLRDFFFFFSFLIVHFGIHLFEFVNETTVNLSTITQVMLTVYYMTIYFNFIYWLRLSFSQRTG